MKCNTRNQCAAARFAPAIALTLLSLTALGQTSNEPAKPELIFGEPSPQSFEVYAGDANESTKGGGIVGGGGYYYAVVTIAPRYELPGDGTARITLDSAHVTRKEIQRQDPHGLALVSWSIDLMDMSAPAGRVTQVKANFDSGSATSDAHGAGTYVFQIPQGASKLNTFEVQWEWGRKQQASGVFGTRWHITGADHSHKQHERL